jgi:hypothetical protein
LFGHRAIRVWWWVLIVGTALNGLVVGYGAIWFQLFGERADRGDYLVSAGGYAAAAAVLVLAAVGVAGLRGPVWAGRASASLAVVLAVLAARSAGIAAGMPEDHGFNGPLDGAGGVLALPWTWPLLVAGVRGAHRLLHSRPRPRT